MSELLLPAILLGLAGSMHCIMMCGPLALALPLGGQTPSQKVVSRILFLGGRLMVYGLMGALVGSLGQGISWLGGQKIWLIAITVFIFLLVAGWNMDWAVSIREKIRNASLQLKNDNPLSAFLLLGVANGLLPCGLVYGALTQSALANNAFMGAVLMLVFGLISSWWHIVLMFGSTFKLPRWAIFQAFASPRGSLALVTVFLVFRLLHTPTQIPNGSPFTKSGHMDVTCSGHP
jgi:sulfite exporter TauE/SafE